MDNKDIVKKLRETANLMELHGENEFKVRGYNNAIYNIERISEPLENLNLSELEKLPGIGKSIASRIIELTSSGSMEVLENYLELTPPEVIEMLNIKGLGTKKIRTLWNDMGITTIEELQSAIESNQLEGLKGFGEKVQFKVLEMIHYYLNNKFKLRYAQAEAFGREILNEIISFDKKIEASFTGQLRRKSEIIDVISLIVGTKNTKDLISHLKKLLEIDDEKSSPFQINGKIPNVETPVRIHLCAPDQFHSQLLLTTGSLQHLHHQSNVGNLWNVGHSEKNINEEDAYKKLDLPYIEPELREDMIEFELAKNGKMPKLLELSDLKGIMHNHTTYSDGRHSLSEMADYCKSLGYEYLGVSDHSKAAGFYANGLDEDRVMEQQQEIDRLNVDLAPFRIFKGIEADILPDGNLDFDPETLATFDFVVASVHSVLNMDIVKATDRILAAVNNPYTTFLGHMTGRLLLVRDAYPLDHKAVIEACAKKNVIIEVNAHPNRLDIDWRWIPFALENNVMLSINPDAHEKGGFHDMYYGVCAARKGGLTKENTFNVFNVEEANKYLSNRKNKFISTGE